MIKLNPTLKLTLSVTVCIVVLLLGIESTWTDSREEEAYRNDAALTMLETGNYAVPYQFGQRYLKKPPGLNWLIAGASIPFGTVTDFSARIPILLLYFFCPLFIYLLTSEFFMRESSILASLASVLYLPWFIEKGPIMEIDLVFTFFVVLSMGVWIYYENQENDLKKWFLSQLAACGAFFIKGPVIFIFYYPSILIYRTLFSDREINWKAFTFGLTVFFVPILTWFLFTLNQVSIQAWIQTTVSEMSGPARRGATLSDLIEHLIKFPFESVFSYLPWILFLTPIANKQFRENWMKSVRKNKLVWFAISTLPIWIVFYMLPDADIRYILPLYPWVGILVASVAELNMAEDISVPYYSIYKNFLGTLLLLLSIAISLMLPNYPLDSPWILVFGVIVLVSGSLSIFWFDGINNCPSKIMIPCLIFIVSLKAVHLFVYHPTEHPDYFTRQKYSTSLGKYLKQKNIKNFCYKSDADYWKYFYLHKMKTGIDMCQEESLLTEKFVLSSDFQNKKFTPIQHFDHRNHKRTTLFKHKSN